MICEVSHKAAGVVPCLEVDDMVCDIIGRVNGRQLGNGSL